MGKQKVNHKRHIAVILLCFAFLGAVVACKEPSILEPSSSRMEGEEAKVRLMGYEEMCKREPEAELCNE